MGETPMRSDPGGKAKAREGPSSWPYSSEGPLVHSELTRSLWVFTGWEGCPGQKTDGSTRLPIPFICSAVVSICLRFWGGGRGRRCRTEHTEATSKFLQKHWGPLELSHPNLIRYSTLAPGYHALLSGLFSSSQLHPHPQLLMEERGQNNTQPHHNRSHPLST